MNDKNKKLELESNFFYSTTMSALYDYAKNCGYATQCDPLTYTYIFLNLVLLCENDKSFDADKVKELINLPIFQNKKEIESLNIINRVLYSLEYINVFITLPTLKKIYFCDILNNEGHIDQEVLLEKISKYQG